MSSEAIVVKELRKRYVTKKRLGLFRSKTEVVEALRGISFHVRYGEVVGLLGPNGAGKTTTIKILSTLLLPDDGEAFVGGYDVVREANNVRKIIGVMFSVEKGFYGKLTGRENLRYFGALYGLSSSVIERRVNELLKLLELDKLGASDKLFEEYSLGMKARLSLARALLKDPPILLLDEPTLGLDPVSARKIRDLVKKLAHDEGKAILYTTHNMFEAELVCDRILLINHGLIVTEGTPNELKSRIPKIRVISLTIKTANKSINILHKVLKDSFTDIPLDIKQLSNEVYELRLKVRNIEEVMNELIRSITIRGYEIVNFKVEEPTLEDVFIYFAGSA